MFSSGKALVTLALGGLLVKRETDAPSGGFESASPG